jgi:hypothetical protein
MGLLSGWGPRSGVVLAMPRPPEDWRAARGHPMEPWRALTQNLGAQNLGAQNLRAQNLRAQGLRGQACRLREEPEPAIAPGRRRCLKQLRPPEPMRGQGGRVGGSSSGILRGLVHCLVKRCLVNRGLVHRPVRDAHPALNRRDKPAKSASRKRDMLTCSLALRPITDISWAFPLGKGHRHRFSTLRRL